MSWLATLVPLVLLILPLVVIVAAVVAFVVLRKKNSRQYKRGRSFPAKLRPFFT